MFCTTCQKIFSENSMPSGILDHHYYPKDLEGAALQGCYICDTVWRRYLFRKPSPPPTPLTFESDMEASRSQFCRYYFVPYGGSRSFMRFSVMINLYFDTRERFDTSESSIVNFNLKPTLVVEGLSDSDSSLVSPGNDSSITSMILARKWLEDCLERHPECRKVIARGKRLKLPTRLLELGMPEPDQVRLWICSEEPHSKKSHRHYMTLSHCWGSAQFLTLTSDTEAKLVKGVPILSLPKSFRNAISVARTMGAEFLWIDSLCIFQDSDGDWQKESALMADIYRGSVCNIAATSAADADQGCLYEKTSLATQPCIFKPAWKYYRNEYILYNEDFWDGIFESDPLRRRAWVVQELLLPHRILHLGRNQMSWECYESRVCEMYPRGIPSFIRVAKRSPLGIVHIESTDYENDVKRDHYNWKHIVHKYTSCNLTNPRDKLIALSGVAKIFQEAYGDEYLAGLWREDLATQLLWHAAFDQLEPLIPSKEYRAPSWSWASVEGRVSVLELAMGRTLIDILDVSIQAAGNDPTGLLIGGFIRISGQLTTIEIEPMAGYRSRFQYRSGAQGDWISTLSVSCNSLESPRSMHCLPIREAYGGYDCLLLIPTRKFKGQFRRWGYISTNLIQGNPSDWLEYEQLNGQNGCVISIV